MKQISVLEIGAHGVVLDICGYRRYLRGGELGVENKVWEGVDWVKSWKKPSKSMEH